jgi:hypothetical protein
MGSMKDTIIGAVISMIIGILGYVIIDAFTGDAGVIVLPDPLPAIISIVWIVIFAAIAIWVLLEGLGGKAA